MENKRKRNKLLAGIKAHIPFILGIFLFLVVLIICVLYIRWSVTPMEKYDLSPGNVPERWRFSLTDGTTLTPENSRLPLEGENAAVICETEIAEDVRLVKPDILGREEGVGRVGLAVSVRHVVGVDVAREIAFRWRDFNLIVSELRINDTDVVMLPVADHHGHGNHGQVRLAGFDGADRPRHGDDVGRAARRVHLKGIEARNLQIDGDSVFRRGNQRRLDGARNIALDGDPLLAERGKAQHDEHDGKDMFFHSWYDLFRLRGKNRCFF